MPTFPAAIWWNVTSGLCDPGEQPASDCATIQPHALCRAVARIRFCRSACRRWTGSVASPGCRGRISSGATIIDSDFSGNRSDRGEALTVRCLTGPDFTRCRPVCCRLCAGRSSLNGRVRRCDPEAHGFRRGAWSLAIDAFLTKPRRCTAAPDTFRPELLRFGAGRPRRRFTRHHGGLQLHRLLPTLPPGCRRRPRHTASPGSATSVPRGLASDVLAAVDLDLGARDVAGLVGTQEPDHVGHFLRLTQPAHRQLVRRSCRCRATGSRSLPLPEQLR